MKKIVSMLLAVCMCLFVGVMFTACGDEEHTHTYQTEWSKDATHHWHACSGEDCTDVADKAEHTWNDGEITTEATAEADGVKTFTCTVCGQTKTETISITDDGDTLESTVVYTLVENYLIIHKYDNEGRLSEMWQVSDELQQDYVGNGSLTDGLSPWYSFTYGDDGRLTHFNGIAISYNDGGDVYYAPSSAYVLDRQLLSVLYHENGMIKEISERYLGTEYKLEKTYIFDNSGRIIGILDKDTNEDLGVGESHMILTYEENKVVMTMKYDGELYDADMTLELNDKGLPSKIIYHQGEQTTVTKEWTYDGRSLTGYSDYQRNKSTTLTYDESGFLIRSETQKDGEVIEYTLYTYNNGGKLLTQKQYDAEGRCQMSDTYEYDVNGTISTITREEADYVRGDTDVYVLTKDGTTWTSTSGESGGSSRCVFNNYDTVLTHVQEMYKGSNDGNGNMIWEHYYTHITEYIYDIPEEACYDYIVSERFTYHTTDHDWFPEDSVRYSYYKIDKNYDWIDSGDQNCDRQVNELTGEYLNTEKDEYGRGFSKDTYGNWLDSDNSIYYYQKYCDGDGRIWYTTDGTRNYLT